MARQQTTAPANSSPGAVPIQVTAPAFALSGRLILEPGGAGDATLGIVRIFDQRARNGFSQGGAPVTVSRATIDAGVALEIEQGGGSARRGVKPVVVQTPADGPLSVQADTTIEVWVELPALPPAGSRVRVSLPIGSATVATDWVEVPASPGSETEALSARARVQRAKRNAGLAATAEQLIAQAPADARGYYYRALALEASGDRAGAIAGYEAALERMPNDGQEPPVAIYRRLARLRAGR